MMINEPKSKKILIVTSVIVVLLLIIAGAALWLTNPNRTLNAFLKAVESKNKEAALSFVSEEVTNEKKENAQWFIEDWVIADTVKTNVEKTEAWRSKKTTDASGKEITEVLPTPRYWSHHYQAFATVSFDDYEDPVIIKLKRDTENTSSRIAQLFRGWKIVQIKYQPIDEADFEQLDDSEVFDNLDDSDAVDPEEDINLDVEDSSDERLSEGATAEDPNSVDSTNEEDTEEDDGGLVEPENDNN